MKEKGSRRAILAVWIAVWCMVIYTGGIHTAFSLWEKIPVIQTIEDRAHVFSITDVEETVLSERPTQIEDIRQQAVPVPIWKENFFQEMRYVPKTSEDYRYKDHFGTVLSEYGQFEDLYYEDYSSPVPGLENTSFFYTSTDEMVPQGLCIAGDYMLVTAYDKAGEHRSVVYVLDNTDPSRRKLLTTIVLPDQNHVGGITCDGHRVWIAKSTTGYLSVIALEWIRKAVESGQDVVFLEKYDNELYCGITASFVSYQDQRLWVGTSQSFITKQGQLTVFHILEDGETIELARQFTMEIPRYAQGISFLRYGGINYLLLNTSYGRFRDSALYVYEAYINDERVLLRGKWKYTFPPMVEELVSDSTYTYCLFESAATCYSTVSGMKCRYPIDRICALDNRQLIDG